MWTLRYSFHATRSVRPLATEVLDISVIRIHSDCIGHRATHPSLRLTSNITLPG